MKHANMKWWILWLFSSLSLAGYFAYALVMGEDKTVYLPGDSSHGHYQIEMACNSCHGEAFDDQEVMQTACVNCHADELKRVDDSHPKRKFTDPRNADRVAILDARYCITCHSEHDQEITADMGVTLASDFCALCHENIATDRVSHKLLPFDGCASAGCHNYHDNKALYEDFLVKHANEPVVMAEPKVAERNYSDWVVKVEGRKPTSLTRSDVDAPSEIELDPLEMSRWQGSAHARGGINCSGCHVDDNKWLRKPGLAICQTCHNSETEGFKQGKHGMRIAVGLDPLRPKDARLAMNKDVHNSQLACNSCHEGHAYYIKKAAAEACLACHDDGHSKAYLRSKHNILWQQEIEGLIDPGQGVSCATCHMPRQRVRSQGHERVMVSHNQNLNLRPNEKMLRGVCMNCHGYEFSVNALADVELVKTNFNGKPKVMIESVKMALKRERTEKSE